MYVWGLVFCKLLANSENIAYLCVTNCNVVTMDEKNNRRNDGQLQLELPQEVAMGEYANFAIITHSSSDFIVDFARVMPGLPKAQVRSRVILAPEHAKRLLAALQENIMRYENEFGPIRIPNKNAPDIVPPFNIPKGEA
jgi:hypothetical protein